MNCFWCGSRMDDADRGSPNPSYRPCASCLRRMLGHTVIIEVSTQARDEAVGLALSAEVVVYPTGLWAPVAPDWLTKKATDHPYIRTVADGGGYVFVDREAWDALGLERPAEAV